jgi:peptide/nickel transport system substrate-binding protein
MKVSRLFFVLLALIGVLSLGSLVSAQDGDTIVFGWEQEPELLTPRTDATFAALIQNFYARGLWDWDRDLNIFPVMVTEIPTLETLDNGNTQITINLREGMLWSDGQPITTADCLFMHEVYMDPTKGTLQRGTYPDVVESVEASSDLSFTVTFNSPFPDALIQAQLLAMCSYPAHILQPVLDAEGTIDNAEMWNGTNVVGYGPYVFTDWTRGDSITLDANPNWDGAAPAFERVVLRFITDTAQMQNAFETGEIDIAFNWSDDQRTIYEAVENAAVFSTPGVYGDALWINTGNGNGNPALRDVRVRMAIAHAIDRPAMAEALVGPGMTVPRSWYAQQFWPSEDQLPLLEFNVEGARALLTEAGWVDDDGDETDDVDNAETTPTPRVAQGVEGVTDGTPLILRFFTTTRQVRMDYQLLIQGYLNEVGVGTQLLPVPATILFADYLERGILDTGDFDLAIFALSTNALSPFADAPDWFGCDGVPSAEDPNGNNGWAFCSEEFDRLDIEVGQTVDVDARLDLAHQAQVEFYNGQFWHGLYLRPTWYAFNTTRIQDTEEVRNMGTLSSNYFNRIEVWQPAG